MKFLVCSLVLICLISTGTYGQKQLVLLKREEVILRLFPGDEIKIRLKGSRRMINSYVNNLFENTLVTHRDTIPFSKIDRIYFRRGARANVYGGILVAGGALFLGIDVLNQNGIQNNDTGLDEGVLTTSLAMVGAGLPLLFIRRNSQRLNYKFRLLVAAKGSPFYRPDPRGFNSPYLDY